ncbi:hypothetical protein [Alteromonas macleodii]|uniref:hypothetical protein n=1 Tax=Alteromonas macleodii TaxID=28108 RepID=UPI0019258ADC|nr:hypothetical protein [Alteromonas macleodii]MBL3811655.1 hypothetical protein [Alteromonas macleodii]MBL3885193.1 hypothetical protein [Alteromonas macleodii]
MGQKLTIAPNEFLFSYAGLKTENVKQGALALNLDWAEESTESADYGTVMKNVVSAAAPHSSIVMCQQGDEAAQSVNALLMSPQDFIVTSFENALPEKADVKEALKSWNNYFKALQQHQYLLGEHFTIQLLSTSSLSKEQQALSNAVRCAMQSDEDTKELLRQFEGFCASDKSQSWVDAVCYGLSQYKSIESTKTECAKANEALKTTNSEKETAQKELTQKIEKIDQLAQQVENLQNELESAANEATNTKNAASEFEAKYKDVSSELAIKNEENTAVAEENRELKSESELLLLQTQQLQEELESVVAEANNSKAAVVDLDNKYKEAINKLSQATEEKQRLEKEKTEQESENEFLLLQIQQLQEELEGVFAEADDTKVAVAELDKKYNEVTNKLIQANEENQRLAKEKAEQASENELLSSQVQQRQEELEATFLALSNLKTDFERIEQDNKKLKEKAKTEEVASAQDKVVAKKVTELEEEKALLNLQISQLQEELESTFAQSEKSNKAKDALIQNLETKLAQVEKHSPELQRELQNAMSEQELLQLQIKQLQEELEFYFTEYQKLKAESPDNKALAEFKRKIEERFPQLVLSESVTLTGGANQKDLQRITARFTQVEHGDKHWNAFSIIVNDRKGALDIELHAPDKKRVYPLSKFVKTGSNKVCDFSLISPFTDAGKKALAELPALDHALLIGIIEELQTKLKQNDVKRTDATAKLDIAPWPEKLLKLATALKQLAPKQAPKPLNFKKLSLKQNMVGATNEHLLISIENLQANGISYPTFDIKVGAKQIKGKAFTDYGSLEFRELANNQAPLATWPPATEDKWGLKLVLDLPAQLNEQQQTAIDSLKEEDKLFIKELLTKLADRFHTLDRKKLKVNQPLENWQKLISGMVAKF